MTGFAFSTSFSTSADAAFAEAVVVTSSLDSSELSSDDFLPFATATGACLFFLPASSALSPSSLESGLDGAAGAGLISTGRGSFPPVVRTGFGSVSTAALATGDDSATSGRTVVVSSCLSSGLATAKTSMTGAGLVSICSSC